MTKSPDGLDLRAVIAVPVRPGPLVRLDQVERDEDEVDELLDELFGAADDAGPSPFDLVLLVLGVAALIGGLMASLTWLVVCGVIAAGLGSILPLRWAWRRVEHGRRSRRLSQLIGDGALLRIDHPAIAELVASHDRVLASGTELAPTVRGEVGEIAHAAVWEVATLLDGRRPVDAAELAYAAARASALTELATALARPDVGTGDAERRRAVIDARHELERVVGRTSLTDADELLRRLRHDDGA